MSSCLFECLKEAGLERFCGAIQRYGYKTAYSLLYLPPARLTDVGISTDSDRQRFLQLVQIIASFHQGGKLSPNQPASPQRRSKQDRSRNSAVSMTHSLLFNGRSSDSGTSEDSPPDYIPSPRRKSAKNRANSAKSPAKNSVMDAGNQISPARHRRQHRRRCSAERNRPDHVTPNETQPIKNDTRDRDYDAQSAGSLVTGRPTEDRRTGVDNATADSVAMSAESLKIHKVLRTKGYNYGLPREDGQCKASGSPKVTKADFKSPVSQRTRENANVVAARPKITVCVRKRPILEAETKSGGFDVITCNDENGGKDGGVVVHELKHTVDMAEFIQQNVFQFDKVFTERNTNQDIYEGALKSMVDWIMARDGRATCFGYGQTGAGKTHTLLGDETEWGVFFHAARDILSRLAMQNQRPNHPKRGCTLSISLYEIYCSRIFDLLNNHKRLQALEDSNKQIHIHGLRSITVHDMNSLEEVVRKGLGERSIGVTGANQDSSRSHAIVQLSIKDAKGAEFSRLSFIDLAGSERASDALRDSDKRNRLEGAEINQSLLALKECIRSLDLALAHTPFRQSKLTQVLRDSFMGNSRTCMIANISPSHASMDHTMNTLRYASRVKELHRRPATSTPQRQGNRQRVSSARTSRHRPFTADPTFSQSRPSASAHKPRPHISRSVSIDSSTKVLDCSAAFGGRGRELSRTPPPGVACSTTARSTDDSRELPNESENIRISSDAAFTAVETQTSAICPATVAAKHREDQAPDRTKPALPEQRGTDEFRRHRDGTRIGRPPGKAIRRIVSDGASKQSASTTSTCSVTSNDATDSYRPNRRRSFESQSSNDSESPDATKTTDSPPALSGDSPKNPGTPSPKKFLTFLKDKQSIKTKALRQRLKNARHRVNSEQRGSEDESAPSERSSSPAGAVSTSHDTLTSNVQQHHRRILRPDLVTNRPTPIVIDNAPSPGALPSPTLDRSEPKRSSRISSRSASPGTGGRTTPVERQSVSSNPATNVGLTSATELRARLAAAAAAVNSQSDTEEKKPGKNGNILPLKNGTMPKVSSSSDKENNDTFASEMSLSQEERNELIYKTQSEVIIAHQEHISEILRISIEEEKLYHNLRERWDKGTSFETYTKSLVKLLSRKTRSIEALKVQLALYDRVRDTYQ